MVLIIVLLIVQIWLLSATLESYLAGHRKGGGSERRSSAVKDVDFRSN
jgi:hypothetical protein